MVVVLAAHMRAVCVLMCCALPQPLAVLLFVQ